MKDLNNIINDIQPLTEENKENRELYERTLSSCLCGSTKQCLTFFLEKQQQENPQRKNYFNHR